MPIMLSSGLLGELQERWAARRVPLRERLSPGLSDAEMDTLVAPLGLRLPREARTWWGWHDGVPAPSVSLDQERWLGPGKPYIPLAEAVAHYRQRRDIARRTTEPIGFEDGDPDLWWHPAWFPISAAEMGIACDCSVRPDEPTPIRAIDWHAMELDDLPKVRAVSFGEMVSWWIEAFDGSAWGYEAAGGGWEYRYELLDPARELTRLV